MHEKELGLVISDKLIWDSHVHLITAKANILLGLLKRSCPLLTKVVDSRYLYLAIVKPHLCYATEVWSPALMSLKLKIERVQRPATRWILRLKPGQMSYKERLLSLDLNMIPLASEREMKEILFFYKAIRAYMISVVFAVAYNFALTSMSLRDLPLLYDIIGGFR